MARRSVGIVGVGKVGGAIAFSMLFHPKVREICIVDIDIRLLAAEYEELTTAARLLGRATKIRANMPAVAKSDYIFITAGDPRRSSRQSPDTIFAQNLKTVRTVSRRLPHTKIYVITNPAERIGTTLGLKWLGEPLDHMREKLGLHGGGYVLDRKGYTNWGIASEAYRIVR